MLRGIQSFGLVQIFPAAAFPIILLGTVLELGKVVAVVWVHRNWKRAEAVFLKPYLIAAIVTLMVVTSIGIYGFMSKAHLQQQAEAYKPTSELQEVESKLASVDSKLARANQTASQIDSALDAYIARGYITKALKTRETLEKERSDLDAKIEQHTNEKRELELKKHQAELTVKGIELEFGPIKYVADLFGYTDMDSAVRVLILMIMFVFDPLALCLMVAAQVSFRQTEKPALNASQGPTPHVNIDWNGGRKAAQAMQKPLQDALQELTKNEQVTETTTQPSGGKNKRDPWWRRLQKR